MTDLLPDDDQDVGAGAAAGTRSTGRPALSVRNTHQLEDLERLVENSFRVSFPHRIWVAGQVAAVAADVDGPVDFVLSSGPGDPLTLDGVIPAEQRRELAGLLDRNFDADVEDLVARGRWLRAGGLLRYSFADQRLDFTVSALDPGPTEAVLVADRSAVRRRVHGDGLPERQRSLPVPAAPLRVAVIAPGGSDTGDQVVDRLRGCGYAMRLRLLPVDLQDRDAAGHLAATLTGAAVDTDLVLLVRRSGRPLGLAPYDTEVVARAIARSPVHVVTGLGGPEACVADDVAAAAAPTALAAADLVVARLDAAGDRLRAGVDDVGTAADAALTRAAGALARAYADATAAAGAAAARADAAERRRMQWLLGAAGAAALLVVALAVATRQPAVLAGLVLVAVLVVALRQQRTRYRTRGSSPMRVPDMGFAAVLERLGRIREELASTSSPERVHELRAEADGLVARGEQILGRPMDPTGGRARQVSAPDGANPVGRIPGGSIPGTTTPAGTAAEGPPPGGRPPGDAPGGPAPGDAASGDAAPEDAAPRDAAAGDAAGGGATAGPAATRPLPGRGPADGEQTAVLSRP